jgi:hypothetical protein
MYVYMYEYIDIQVLREWIYGTVSTVHYSTVQYGCSIMPLVRYPGFGVGLYFFNVVLLVAGGNEFENVENGFTVRYGCSIPRIWGRAQFFYVVRC